MLLIIDKQVLKLDNLIELLEEAALFGFALECSASLVVLRRYKDFFNASVVQFLSQKTLRCEILTDAI